MKKLRIQFGIFFIFLAAISGALLWNSYRQLNQEEEELWKGRSEKVFNHLQAEISDFLMQEDERSFSHYRYFYIPGEEGIRRRALIRSPLSRLPQNDPHGLIGYFQIDPDHNCTTPYLPQMEVPFRLHDEKERQELQNRLKLLTESLHEDIHDGTATRQVTRKRFGFVELGPLSFSHELVIETDSAEPASPESEPRSEVYPNPLQQQIRMLERRQEIATTEADKERIAKIKERLEQFAEKYPRREVKTDPSQVQTFAEQSDALEEEIGQTSPHRRATTTEAVSSIYIDPFQARLVAEDTLIFYRKVWLDQQLYIQGFAMDLTRFFSWLMGQSFANSDLPDFSVAKLSLDDHTLTGYGRSELAQHSKMLLFERHLGYPLNRFIWQVLAAYIPHHPTRLYLYALTAAVILLITVGLYLIYRSAAAQVQLAQKREDFASAVTHELRTPLTSIRMYSEMLEDNLVTDEAKRQRYYHQIHKESGRLSRLIDNILQLARLEKGTYKLSVQRADPSQDFDELAKELAVIATSKGYVLESHRDQELPAVKYDHEAVKQILLTLLDNSIKFTSQYPNKTLKMSLHKNGDHAVWSWRDFGPGIPKKYLKKVFQKFYRVETESTRRTQGTGIGLAMAHMLADAMGAKMAAVNVGSGGLEIRLCLYA